MKNNNCVLVLTALPVERDAVTKHLTGTKLEKRTEAGTDYHRGIFASPSGNIDVVVGRTGQTNINAIAASLGDARFAPKISVLSGTIASGEKVDASCKSDLHKYIKTNASHALAIEMEGLGFLNVCMTRPAVKSLLLRGISDLVNDKGKMDGKGSQVYASQNVAAFLFGLITELDLSNFKEETSKAKQLFEIVCKLYPRGVEDKRIWERAGGDLSMVTLTMQGKGQWFEAIRLIEQGGGGAEIALNTLIQAMLEDFTQNKDLLRILGTL